MSNTTVKIGNIFESKSQTIVNTVNCVGVMGKGIAAEFKKRYPAMFREYKSLCNAGKVKLGEPYLYRDLTSVGILNFPTKGHWRSASRIQDIEDGLDYFVEHYEEWGIESVAFPPLGCGNGGLKWDDVGRLMYQKLSPLPIEIELYAPFGTVTTKLHPKFLSQKNESQQLIGTHHTALKDSWLALVEVVYRLSKQQYTSPVGRIVFQKITYIMTELGVDTGFTFSKGSYGPFSEELQSALTIIANANLFEEKQLGRMLAFIPSDTYEKQRREIYPRLDPYEKWINKTVDLFSRIKNTEQAEEVTTVIYAVQQLKAEADDVQTVSEQAVLDFIMKWKKSWRTDEKSRLVASTIRHLQLLGWVKLKPSDSPYPELIPI